MKFIDFHVHPVLNLERIYVDLSKMGISWAVLHPVDVDVSGHLSLRALMEFEELRTSEGVVILKSIINRFTDLVKNWPDYMLDNLKLYYEVLKNGLGQFFIPFASINPSLGVRYVEQKLEEVRHLGIRGIYVTPIVQFFNLRVDPGFRLLLEEAEREGLILVLNLSLGPDVMGPLTAYFSPSNLAALLNEYKPTIVLTGIGTPHERAASWFDEALKLTKRFDNVYLDTADFNCFIFSRESNVARLRRYVGIERVIFGSRYPCRGWGFVNREIDCISSSRALSWGERERIMLLNALEILKGAGAHPMVTAALGSD